MLINKTPVGEVQIPVWLEKELVDLTDEELLQKAIDQNKAFCISPAVYAMIEKRFLSFVLQKRINPGIGFSHATLRLIEKM